MELQCFLVLHYNYWHSREIPTRRLICNYNKRCACMSYRRIIDKTRSQYFFDHILCWMVFVQIRSTTHPYFPYHLITMFTDCTKLQKSILLVKSLLCWIVMLDHGTGFHSAFHPHKLVKVRGLRRGGHARKSSWGRSIELTDDGDIHDSFEYLLTCAMLVWKQD